MTAVLIDEQMLVSAVRYALGRSTYIVALTCSQVKASWWEISGQARRVIDRDVYEALEGPNTSLGGQVDHDEWEALSRFISEQGLAA